MKKLELKDHSRNKHFERKYSKNSRPIDLFLTSRISYHYDHCTADRFNSIKGKVISGLDNSVDRFGLYWNSALDNTSWDYETERLMSFPVSHQTRKAETVELHKKYWSIYRVNIIESVYNLRIHLNLSVRTSNPKIYLPE